VNDVSVADDQQTATVKVCLWETGILYEIRNPGTADEAEANINTDKTSYKTIFTLIPERGSWYLYDSQDEEVIPEKNVCPMRPA
jgi:hypothetical protein